MSMDKATLEAHIKMISLSPNIKNKIVVLCEGRVISNKVRSPQDYSKLGDVPDANFYRNCVPHWWTQQRPEFFTCGGRTGVIDTYFGLLEYQKQSPANSYLNPDKLFALVDLDLPPYPIPHYPFADIESIFADLYHAGEVNLTTAPHHRIWVTGLLHKEAYFFHPMLQEFFDHYPTPPMLNHTPLQLKDVYFTMSQTLVSDAGLQQHFSPRLCQRINFCQGLNCISLADLQQSWQAEFHKLAEPSQNLFLIYSLLMIVKSKNFWSQVESMTGTPKKNQYQDQLVLAIARYIATQAPQYHHLRVFFETLHQFI